MFSIVCPNSIIHLFGDNIALQEAYRLLYNVRTIPILLFAVPLIGTLEIICATLIHPVILRVAHKHMGATPHQTRIRAATYGICHMTIIDDNL